MPELVELTDSGIEFHRTGAITVKDTYCSGLEGEGTVVGGESETQNRAMWRQLVRNIDVT